MTYSKFINFYFGYKKNMSFDKISNSNKICYKPKLVVLGSNPRSPTIISNYRGLAQLVEHESIKQNRNLIGLITATYLKQQTLNL
jgi:hypothetical protein